MATLLPENNASFTLGAIALATSGSLGGASPDARVEGIATDTRGNVKGRLFVALVGEHFDGHAYVSKAARGGAAAVLVEREVGDVGIPVVRVGSTLSALRELAHAHRRRWGGTVVAVAGSAGKTTTKSAIFAVLDALYPGKVHHARGNLNNFVGVPLVLFGLAAEHLFSVVEIGTNAPGEVSALAACAAPNVGVLTLVALEHTQGLVDLDGVEREEGGLLQSLDPDGIAIGNGDDERVARLLGNARARRRYRYGFGDGMDVRAVRREPLGMGSQRVKVRGRLGELDVEVPLVGEAGTYAALAAVAVGEALTGKMLDAELVSEALAKAGEPGRLKPHELDDGTIVLDDTYNANPASVLSSVRAAQELAAARRAGLVLVVGEMRELGAVSEAEHAHVGAELGESGARALVAVGGDAIHYVEPAQAGGVEAMFADDALSGLELARSRIEPGDVVLVKASRGIRAERIVNGLLSPDAPWPATMPPPPGVPNGGGAA
jgi:UDP-N-acetylmuramoyl-tripeptide--D-alanyl-D-alanine ligase